MGFARLSRDPSLLAGEPCIRGMWISARSISGHG